MNTLPSRNGKTFFKTALFFVLALAGLAFAASSSANSSANITKEVGYYKNPNEIVGVIDVASNGTTYELVRINGVESVILLQNSAGGFDQVKDEATLNAVVSKYTADHISELIDQTRITTLADDFDTANGARIYCGNASTKLFKYYAPDLFKFVLASATGGLDIITNKTGTTGNSIEMLSAEGKVLNRTFKATQALVAQLRGNTISDADYIYGLVDNVSSLMSTAKEHTPAYLTHYAKVYATAAQYLERKSCNFSTTPIDTVINDAAFKEQLPRVPRIVEQVKTITAQRGDVAQVRKILEEKQARFSQLKVTVASLSKKLAPLGLSFPDLDAKVKTLQTDLDKLGNTSTVVAASVIEKDFNSAYADASAQANSLDKSALLSDVSDAKNRTSTSRDAVQNASDRLGAIPETDQLKERYGVLKQNLDAKLELLQKSPSNVTSADFQAITAEAALLETDSAAAQPSWTKIDPLMVGGAVVFIALIGASVWYYREQKKKRENAPVYNIGKK